jgi:hypothetical protein
VWQLKGTGLEFCSCDPGCGCNFRGVPSSPEGNCEAFLCHVIEEGSDGDVDLSGTTIAWALWWPGAIHEKGGRGHAYIDCETDQQFGSLSRIVQGRAGYEYFEIFNSTFEEPTAVERAAVDVVVDGLNSRFAVADAGEAAMQPLRSPVTGEENDVRIVKPGGFIWKEGRIAQGSTLRVDIPGISFDVPGRHAVLSTFDWSA